MVEGYVSSIIRFHEGARFEILKDALYSVSIQTYSKVQIVVVCQNLTGKALREITSFIEDLPFLSNLPVKINPPRRTNLCHLVLNLRTKSNDDIRGRLLDHGLSRAHGRYIAFLDYDDVIYQGAYELLVGNLRRTNGAIAVGGSVIVHQKVSYEFPYVSYKGPWLLRSYSLLDFFIENFIPIHSFVVDRKKVRKDHLLVNRKLQAYEDYCFLMNVLSRYPADLSGLGLVVCEYRFRDDNTNSTPHYKADTVKAAKWAAGRKVLESLKAHTTFTMNTAELSKLLVIAQQEWGRNAVEEYKKLEAAKIR